MIVYACIHTIEEATILSSWLLGKAFPCFMSRMLSQFGEIGALDAACSERWGLLFVQIAGLSDIPLLLSAWRQHGQEMMVVGRPVKIDKGLLQAFVASRERTNCAVEINQWIAAFAAGDEHAT